MAENFSTLIGVLVDVSGSMESKIGDGVEEEGGDWVRSIFKVIDNLIKHDVSAANSVFAIGFGTSRFGNGTFDIMRTLKRWQNRKIENNPRNYEDTIERMLQILEVGATSVRKWASIPVISAVVSHSEATIILRELERNRDFVEAFVNEYLPPQFKGLIKRTPLFPSFEKPPSLGDIVFSNPISHVMSTGANAAAEFIATTLRPATEDDVFDVKIKAIDAIEERFSLEHVVVPSSIYSVHEASRILHGCVDEDTLTDKRVKELKEIVEPAIYGGTPFYTSLKLALKLFRYRKYQHHKKLLFVLSDGCPSDSEKADNVLSQFSCADVTIVGCYITRSTEVEPRRLFNEAEDSWESGAKLMFDLSSKITTQLLYQTIFTKRGWKIDIANNETKLFLQVNHPDIMKDACRLARNVVCYQDVLADVLVTVSLDMYINQSISKLNAPDQGHEQTCYSHASATVLHLTMKRILRREEYPDFDDLRDELIARIDKTNGKKKFRALKAVCSKYGLHCKKVSKQEAMAAITAKRPVIAKYRLSDDEKKIFKRFYDNNKTGILTSKELDITKRPRNVKISGHAVVLTSFNSEYLFLMNSWGVDWGDNGFFRVQNAEVIGLEFIDVFWMEEELTDGEKEYYVQHGAEVANELMSKLKGLQYSTYQCPRCSETSKVTEYSGKLVRAKCPKCNEEFKCEGGNILALNMYLTALSR